MLITVTIAALIYALRLITWRTVITPDGNVYLAMGRGELAPRPYAYRLLPHLVKGIMAWRVIHAVSWFTLAIVTHVLAERMEVNGTLVTAALLCLPTIRQSINWPVLLDIPILAVATSVALLSTEYQFAAVLLLPFTIVVHERAPFLAALYCLPFVPFWWLVIAVIAVVVFIAQLHESHPGHPDEQRVEWLRNPLKAAITKHAGTFNDWSVWVKPLGLSFAGIVTGGWWQLIALAFGYAGCLVAQDRVRIYSVAALPLTLAAVSTFGEYGVLVPLVNWFTNTNEV